MVWKKIIGFLFLVFFAVSCNHKEKQDIRKDMLNQKDMVKLLVEVHIVEALVEERRNSGNLRPGEIKLFYDQLFAKYKINPELFYKNINYYLERPQEFLKIYEKVITELSKKQGAAVIPR